LKDFYRRSGRIGIFGTISTRVSLIAGLPANIADVFPEDWTRDQTGDVVFKRMTAVARFAFAVVLAKLTASAPMRRHVFEGVTAADERRDADRSITK